MNKFPFHCNSSWTIDYPASDVFVAQWKHWWNVLFESVARFGQGSGEIQANVRDDIEKGMNPVDRIEEDQMMRTNQAKTCLPIAYLVNLQLFLKKAPHQTFYPLLLQILIVMFSLSLSLISNRLFILEQITTLTYCSPPTMFATQLHIFLSCPFTFRAIISRTFIINVVDRHFCEENNQMNKFPDFCDHSNLVVCRGVELCHLMVFQGLHICKIDISDMRIPPKP